MTTHTQLTTAPERAVGVSWNAVDHHRVTTWVAVGGAIASLALALWGLPPIDLHGPLHRFGIMDFLCGGTRAAYYTVKGDWGTAWYYNPLGPLAVISAGLVMLRSAVGLATRRWLNVTVNWTRRRLVTVLTAGTLVAVALTIRQQLMVDVLL